MVTIAKNGPAIRTADMASTQPAIAAIMVAAKSDNQKFSPANVRIALA